MISINNLTKRYGDMTVLDIEQLDINTGGAIGLVGNNGAGKTTLFSLLLDLIEPTTGHISSNGVRVDEDEAWKPFTSAFVDESFLIGYLTPEEYLYFIGELRGQDKNAIDALIADFSDFFNGEALGQKKYLRDLSKGNQKKVGIVAALIGKPKVVILDEPFANLDPSTQIRLKKIIKGLAEDPEVTVLVSSHDLQHVTEVAQRVVLLEKGKVVKDIVKTAGTFAELETYFKGISESYAPVPVLEEE